MPNRKMGTDDKLYIYMYTSDAFRARGNHWQLIYKLKNVSFFNATYFGLIF